MIDGFFRIATVSTKTTVADPAANASNIIETFSLIAAKRADLAVFPEMSVTAYTCGDLFHNATLYSQSISAVKEICKASESAPSILILVGAPVRFNDAMYNCAIAICNGKIKAIVPKTYIPNYNEFYERRWFAPAPPEGGSVDFAGQTFIPFGADILIEHKGIKTGIEICEDLWTPIPPSCRLTLGGALVIANLSASDDITGKYSYLQNLVAQQSARCLCAYAYSSAGFGESSTDLVFDSKLFIAENGRMLAQNKRWQQGTQIEISDVDTEALIRDRIHNSSFAASQTRNNSNLRIVSTEADADSTGDTELLRKVDPHPFVPSDTAILADRCEEIINIQVAALAKRLDATNCHNLVVGVSGGLDSTLALLIAARTFDRLGLDRKGITGVTMPGFGTTGRTYKNACTLMSALGITQREISIVPAVNQHFADIGHDASIHDVTYENSQARERTQILMDVANQTGGMVLGTGDLSELALGWATYNGDHMSMYAVNAGVPKTLVKYLTQYFATEAEGEEKASLLDIIDTPISPELLPANAEGDIDQKTEDLVGPYELHDFFLYYMLRYGFTPKRIFKLATKAFEGNYDRETILKWERIFFRRFFNQQFKRSCLPDGPKVGSVCLSPRGDWRMPSDASSAAWLAEIDKILPNSDS